MQELAGVRGFDKTQLRKAAEMGNPDVAFKLGVVLLLEQGGPGLTEVENAKLKSSMTYYWKRAVDLYTKRADAGDPYAIYKLAAMANNSSIAFYTFDHVEESNHWFINVSRRTTNAARVSDRNRLRRTVH